MLEQDAVKAVCYGDHPDPFGFLGMHRHESGGQVVRVFMPGATQVVVLDTTHQHLATLDRVDEQGFFSGILDRREPCPYRLGVTEGQSSRISDDPYRFASRLGEMDEYLMVQGRHLDSYTKLGAQIVEVEGVTGVSFMVWAPNAARVSVVGDFNNMDGRRHVMRKHRRGGIWEIFIPDIVEGDSYMYEIKHPEGFLLPLKADPYGFHAQVPPQRASVVFRTDNFQWNDKAWMTGREHHGDIDRPISVYEVHLGSWKRKGKKKRFYTYLELADELIDYVLEMGFTHIELLPVSEFPFDGSWGYQPIGLFAPTSRYGTPADFAAFVDRCHQAGIGVILDWVPGHFPMDEHGLREFDGTHLYEHADPKQGYHPQWETMIYNYGRNEVHNFLVSNALFWLDRYHIDGLRVDAVASMLHLNYARRDGEWIPNKMGGNKNLEAVQLLKNMNTLIDKLFPGVITIAEESTTWPGVTQPVAKNGLGFKYKWNLGWMNDTLKYMKQDPIYRKFHHDSVTFGLVYAFKENYVLPLSHDEVVHLKGSLIARMPGDAWQQFANLRAYFGFMFGHPGKKLLFMGDEFGQGREWNFNAALDWDLLDIDWHQGVHKLIKDLNHAYRDIPALHQMDCEPHGFRWVKVKERETSIFAWLRMGLHNTPPVLVVTNFTPLPRGDVLFGVPEPGFYAERINTDLEIYKGSNVNNGKGVRAKKIKSDGLPYSIRIIVPPLSTCIFELVQK